MMEQHKVIINQPNYQRISNDIRQNEIALDAVFHYGGNMESVRSGDFKLHNLNRLASWYVIDKVLYCNDEKRIEVHICNHPEFKGEFSEKQGVDLSGLKLGHKDRVEMIFRVTNNARTSDKKECEDGISGTPDDKDGSILIGVRTFSTRFEN